MELNSFSVTVEVVKAGWPIVIALVGVTFWVAGVYFMAKGTKDKLQEFLKGQFPVEKNALLEAIKQVKEAQIRSEERLESKLDKMSTDTDQKLDRLFEKQNQTNATLAEIKGRLYHLVSTDSPTNGG